MTPFC